MNPNTPINPTYQADLNLAHNEGFAAGYTLGYSVGSGKYPNQETPKGLYNPDEVSNMVAQAKAEGFSEAMALGQDVTDKMVTQARTEGWHEGYNTRQEINDKVKFHHWQKGYEEAKELYQSDEAIESQVKAAYEQGYEKAKEVLQDIYEDEYNEYDEAEEMFGVVDAMINQVRAEMRVITMACITLSTVVLIGVVALIAMF